MIYQIKTYLLFILLVSSLVVNAATCTSIKSGDFNDPTVWDCGKVPDKNDDVIINHTINLNVEFKGGNAIKGTWTINIGAVVTNPNGNDFEVASSGTLNISGTMNAADVEFKNGATVTILLGGTLNVTGDLKNENNSTSITVNGTINVAADFENKTNATIVGGGIINVIGDFTNASTGIVFGCAGTGCNCTNCTLAPVALPIELISLTAHLTDNKNVKIIWITGTEINNDYFTLEKSTNGLTFEEIAQVNGAGNSTMQLEYTSYDNQPQEGTTYYRLTQTDFDGRFEIFDLISVNMQTKPNGDCVLQVNPNPCTSNCSFQLTDCHDHETAEIEVELIDASGNKIFSRIPYRETDGSFSFYMDNSNNLAPGMYILRAKNKSENYTKKVIVK